MLFQRKGQCLIFPKASGRDTKLISRKIRLTGKPKKVLIRKQSFTSLVFTAYFSAREAQTSN